MVPAAGELLGRAELSELYTRVERLQAADLLSEAEAFEITDCLSDFVDVVAAEARHGVVPAVVFGQTVETVHRLAAQSSVLHSDATFARQIRRKFISK